MITVKHTWAELCEAVQARIDHSGIGLYGTGVSDQRTWAQGTPDLRSGLELLRKGYPEGASAIAAQLDSADVAQENKPTWERDAGGEWCDVPAYIAGAPEYMMARDETPRPTPTCALVISFAYNATTTEEEVLRYCTALTAVVRGLVAQGVDPALYAEGCNSSTAGGAIEHRHSVLVRAHGEPLDLDRIACAMHPAMNRRAGFAVLEMTWPATGYSYGYSNPANARDCPIEGEERVIYLPSLANGSRLREDIYGHKGCGRVTDYDSIVAALNAAIAGEPIPPASEHPRKASPTPSPSSGATGRWIKLKDGSSSRFGVECDRPVNVGDRVIVRSQTGKTSECEVTERLTLDGYSVRVRDLSPRRRRRR